ncbi:MAG TPA: hypothetical protein VJ779_20145, partial [Acetobacteraceae bacterium]|nr:hypothetical protein [Acetobacteraceae bacterium]
MQMQFGRILCGVLIGLIALAWIRPVTEAGSGLVILLSLLLVQVVASLAGVTRRLLRRQPAAETDQGGRPPSALAVLVLLAAAAQFPAHAFEAPPGKGSLSLELVNHSAGTVKSIAVTLGAKVVSEQSITVPPGKQYRVTLPSEGGTCTYDIKVRLEVNKVTISETIRSVNFCTLPSGVLEVKPPASDLSSHRFHEALAEFHALRLPPNATTGSAFGAAPPSVSSPPLAPPVFAPVP